MIHLVDPLQALPCRAQLGLEKSGLISLLLSTASFILGVKILLSHQIEFVFFRRKEAENSWMLPGLEAQIEGEHKKVILAGCQTTFEWSQTSN